MAVFAPFGPLSPESALFRGREAELKKLVEMCTGEVRRFAIVFGARQTGKSSLLLRLQARLPKSVLTCHVDCQDLSGATISEVYSYLAETLAGALPGLEVPQRLRRASDLAAQLGSAVRATERGRLVLLLEELGALPDDTRTTLARGMRYLFSNRHALAPELSGLMIVFAGAMEMYALGSQTVSPLRNICDAIYLSDLAEAEAVGLVADGLGTLGVEEVQAVALGEAVFRQVRGHPYLTQLMGSLLEEDLADGAPLSEGRVAAAADRVVAENQLLLHIRRGMEEMQLQPAAESLLEGRVPFDRGLHDMARLELLGLAAGEDGFWGVRSPLLRRALEQWLTREASARGRIDELAGGLRHELAVVDGYRQTLPDGPDNVAQLARMRLTLSRYRQQYVALQGQVPAVYMLNEIATLLGAIESRLAGLMDQQETMIDDVAVLRADLVSRFARVEQFSVATVVGFLDPSQLPTVLALMEAVPDLNLAEGESQDALEPVRRVLNELRRRDRPTAVALSREAAAQFASDLDAPGTAVSHKLKLCIPLIPFFLAYEAELETATRIELRAAWDWLVARVRKRALTPSGGAL